MGVNSFNKGSIWITTNLLWFKYDCQQKKLSSNLFFHQLKGIPKTFFFAKRDFTIVRHLMSTFLLQMEVNNVVQKNQTIVLTCRQSPGQRLTEGGNKISMITFASFLEC